MSDEELGEGVNEHVKAGKELPLGEAEDPKIAFTLRAITNIDILANYPFLRIVVLSGNLLTDFSPLSCISNLHLIDLSTNTIKFAGQVAPLQYLQFFDLSNNQIEEISDNKIDSLVCSFSPLLNCKDLPALKTLELRGNKLDSLAGIWGVERIEKLYVAQNELTSIHEDINSLRQLKILHLRENPIKKLDGFNKHFLSLQTLNLRGCMVKRYVEVNKLKVLPSLIDLTLSENPIADKEDYRMVVIGYLSKLMKLDKDKVSKLERTEAAEFIETRVEENEPESDKEIDNEEKAGAEADEAEEED